MPNFIILTDEELYCAQCCIANIALIAGKDHDEEMVEKTWGVYDKIVSQCQAANKQFEDDLGMTVKERMETVYSEFTKDA